MALTKADMAESLFEELGLNKREARELVDLFFEVESRSSYPVSETSICATRMNDRDEIPKRAKKYRSRRDA